MPIVVQADDGSIFTSSGNLLHFGTDLFSRLYPFDDFCFLCGNFLADTEKNKEHVIPAWIQRRCNLSSKYITLPNNTKFPYKSWRINTCASCNQYLSKNFEVKISKAFDRGLSGVQELVESDAGLSLFQWACLLYFKVHLKDGLLKDNLDHKKSSGKISDIYDITEFHHFHAIARSKFSGIQIVPDVLGTITLVKLDEKNFQDSFDYRDHYLSKTLMLRIRDIAIIFVLNDCGAVGNMIEHKLAKFLYASPIHLAEILTEHQCANLHIKNRPKFFTHLNKKTNMIEISTNLPKHVKLKKYNPKIRGDLMLYNLQPYMRNLQIDGLPPGMLEEKIREGYITLAESEVTYIARQMSETDA